VTTTFEEPRRSVHERSRAPALRGRAPAASKQIPATWTTGAKDGIGTAYFHPDSGLSQSNVWYTLTRGVLTEVYYPDVSCANLRVLQFAVSDGKSFADVEEQDTVHSIRLVYSDALVYEQVNRAKRGSYEICKTYVTNPRRHALLVKVTFRALVGKLDDYRLYVYLNPTLDNGGPEVYGRVHSMDGRTILLSTAGDTSMAVTSSCPMGKASTGYIGSSDGLEDLKQHFDLTDTYGSAIDGNISQTAHLELDSRGETEASLVIAIGFGESPAAAVDAAQASLHKEFAELLAEYRTGWQGYLQTLTRPELGSVEQYNVAAMVLKAHEDKRHPGAIVASLTIPWGDKVVSAEGGIGGYHLVWSRDFYHVASTLYAIGDRCFAARALAYLDDIQQLPDGSFPQNSWLDGTPYWRGLQLDEVAFPILLAYQTGDVGRYESMVRPAADFIVNNGPLTPQERWEENAGYSPSTLAAEVAALVAAGEMARQRQDFGSAARYLATADLWSRKIDEWTVATGGPLSEAPYYIRISDTRNPNDNHWIHIANGGGWKPKNTVVDAGFLELVRLGIKAPDDAVITASLNVIDGELMYETQSGPVWRRYSFDGYGEKPDGLPYEGSGVGRPWPFLSGERGEYEIAFAQSRKRTTPEHLYGAERLLQAMAGAANGGYLIPEQVWDGENLPEHHLVAGEGTGSATPLAWAMAQYLRLCQCIRTGRIVEMPEVVQQRYLQNPPGIGPAVEIQNPEFGAISHESQVELHGRTEPGATVVICGAQEVAVRADGQGRFSATVALWTVGKNSIRMIGYDNDKAVSEAHFLVFYEPRLVWAMSDPPGDDSGPGSYQYPHHPDFHKGDLDLWQLRVLADDSEVYFDIELGRLDDPWEGPSGISKQLIDVYLFNPGLKEEVQRQTRGLNAEFRQGLGWNRMIRISGNWHGEANVYGPQGQPLGPVRIEPQYTLRRISAAVSIEALGGVPESGWRIMVVTSGEENGGPRPIRAVAGEWDFGGGSDDGRNPLIVDMLIPPGESQQKVLDWRGRSDRIQLPMITM